MYRKNLLIFMVVTLLMLSSIGCSKHSTTEANNSQKSEAAAVPLEPTARTIIDLGGNRVTLPPSQEIKRVVIISPPTTSILLSVIPNSNMIVGVNPRAFTTANTKIIEKLFPNRNSVETAFVSKGFVSNTEELLNLDPDIVFYYGESQKSGIENLDVPIIDFLIKGENNPETVTIAWDNLMREIFEIEGSTSLESEWNISNQTAQELLTTNTGEKKKALFLFSNTGGIITVYGSGTYADTWFKKSGLENVASNVKGNVEVSMEQLYAWNPDYIYVFIGNPASVMLRNEVQGQNWSLLTAYKNKTIIDIPQAAYSWGAPCSDSPLMPLWMISRSYPELMPEIEFTKFFKKYYERMYSLKLEEELIASILSPRIVQAKN